MSVPSRRGRSGGRLAHEIRRSRYPAAAAGASVVRRERKSGGCFGVWARERSERGRHERPCVSRRES